MRYFRRVMISSMAPTDIISGAAFVFMIILIVALICGVLNDRKNGIPYLLPKTGATGASVRPQQSWPSWRGLVIGAVSIIFGVLGLWFWQSQGFATNTNSLESVSAGLIVMGLLFIYRSLRK